MHRVQAYHEGVTTIEELDQSSLHPLIKYPKTDMSRPRIEPGVPSTKELASHIYINLNILDLYCTLTNLRYRY
jgi:hypothetical protein